MTSSDTGQRSTGHGQAYGQWVAPKEDGALLIWPDAPALAARVCENVERLNAADHVVIAGVPLPELRRAGRQFLGQDDDRPLIATGHQTELHHPGVWVKNAVICAAADRCGGVALHVAVDTDAPKHLKLKWPRFAAPITDDARLNRAPWSGLLDPPTPAHLDGLIDAADAAGRDGRAGPLLGEFLRGCRAYLVDQHDAVAPLDLPGVLANGQHQLDWSLGLHYTEVTLGGLLGSEAWAAFALHLLADAERFAAAYNAALADYRREAGIHAPDRPMPDLAISDGLIELPFWLDDLARSRRRRAVARRLGSDWVLDGLDGGATFDFKLVATTGARGLLDWSRANDLRLAPRALTLTLFLRLIMCDLFVHGIGGGHYDQVTDRIIRDYFGLLPPTFAVATATLYHPQAVGRERICLACLAHEGHALAHRALGERKRDWLVRIAAADGFRARREAFDAMHAARRAALPLSGAYQAWQARLAAAERQRADEVEVFDRELFYAVQPVERLNGMIERVRTAFALPPASATRGA